MLVSDIVRCDSCQKWYDNRVVGMFGGMPFRRCLCGVEVVMLSLMKPVKREHKVMGMEKQCKCGLLTSAEEPKWCERCETFTHSVYEIKQREQEQREALDELGEVELGLGTGG